MSEKVGFVGLGIMGMGMARNLLKAGFDLTVWNRTASKADALAGEGATRASSPAELAARCGRISVLLMRLSTAVTIKTMVAIVKHDIDRIATDDSSSSRR